MPYRRRLQVPPRREEGSLSLLRQHARAARRDSQSEKERRMLRSRSLQDLQGSERLEGAQRVDVPDSRRNRHQAPLLREEDGRRADLASASGKRAPAQAAAGCRRRRSVRAAHGQGEEG